MMNKEIKERIETINKGEVPDGYKRTRYIGIAPKDWTLGKLSDAIVNKQRPVPKPNKPYWRLGIKSWAKGTFHTFVENPDDVNMEELYVVHENDLIVNITFAWEHAIAIVKNDDEGLLVSHRFPTYEFKENQIPQFYKAVISQCFFKEMLENISPGGAGRNRVLNRKDFLNLPCYIPPVKEQEKIAEILSQCDTVIEECKKQMEEYKSLKKTCLNKMFPKKGSNIPEIRFPGFADAWEQRKLGELGKMKNGMNFSKESMGIGFPLVNLQNVFGNNVIDCSNLGKAMASPAQLREYSLKKGDVLFVRSSVKLEGVGEAALVPKNLENTTYSGFIIRFRDDTGLNDNFKKYVFSTEPIRIQIMSHATDSANKNISQSVLSNLDVFIPSTAEQEKIGKYFEHLDNLINLHQHKADAYTQMKKALTQLLLTGIVRVNKQKEILP